MSRTIVVIGAGGIDGSTVQGGELFAPVCRKARSAGKQERGKWPSEQHLGRAGTTGTRRVTPFQETALERIGRPGCRWLSSSAQAFSGLSPPLLHGHSTEGSEAKT